ncbi:helix-turn-helix domain-containing protein [Pseudoxanthomonas mexicana]
MSQKKLAYTLEEAATATGLPKRSLYRHMHEGDLITFKSGRRRMVSQVAIENLIKKLEKQTQAAA